MYLVALFAACPAWGATVWPEGTGRGGSEKDVELAEPAPGPGRIACGTYAKRR